MVVADRNGNLRASEIMQQSLLMRTTNHELVELRVARLVAARRPSVQLRGHGRQPLQHVRRRAHLRRVIS